METPEQSLIINHEGGHAKVFACPGSGKTFVLTKRNRVLVERKIPAMRILNVMFNKEASVSFSRRLKQEVPSSDIGVYTFNGIGNHYIKRLVKHGILPERKLLLFPSQNRANLREIVGRFHDPREKGFWGAVFEFERFVDLAKSCQQPLGETFKEYEFAPKHSFFIQGFKEYETLRKKLGVMTFADQIYDLVEALQESDKALALCTGHYDEINVDEYQDISDTQQMMVKLLAGQQARVMAVGDDDQCIYTWRGSRPGLLIRDFDKDFPDPSVFTLSTTFRNGHSISLAASYLIRNNIDRMPKVNISSMTAKETRIVLDNATAAQSNVVTHVNGWLESGRQMSEAVVLVRAYSAAIPVELALLEAGIPYRIDGGEKVLSSVDIGSVVTALHIANGSLLDLPAGLVAPAILRFVEYYQTGLTDVEYSQLRGLVHERPEDYRYHLAEMMSVTAERWVKANLQTLDGVLAALEGAGTASDYLPEVLAIMGVENRIVATARDEEAAEEARQRIHAISAYCNHRNSPLPEFCRHLAELEDNGEISGEESLLITSIHRSKGLEWPLVIMPGLIHGKFPLYRAKTQITPKNLEEERRLFYVGITRSQELLCLIAPKDPALEVVLSHGEDKPREMLEHGLNASQFLYEMNLFLAQHAPRILEGTASIDADQLASKEVFVNYRDKLETIKKNTGGM